MPARACDCQRSAAATIKGVKHEQGEISQRGGDAGFPDRIAYGASGGPSWQTQVAATAGGYDARNADWSYPRHRWDVSQGVKTQADFETLLHFFMAMRGRLHSWRFKDWGDFSATHSQGVVTGLTASTFQMYKRYTAGSQTVDRIIRKPVTNTLEVKVSGPPTAATVDTTTTGIITIVSEPAAANVSWSAEFDVPMRFDTDLLDRRIVSRSQSAGLLHEWQQIQIVEVRV